MSGRFLVSNEDIVGSSRCVLSSFFIYHYLYLYLLIFIRLYPNPDLNFVLHIDVDINFDLGLFPWYFTGSLHSGIIIVLFIFAVLVSIAASLLLGRISKRRCAGCTVCSCSSTDLTRNDDLESNGTASNTSSTTDIDGPE